VRYPNQPGFNLRAICWHCPTFQWFRFIQHVTYIYIYETIPFSWPNFSQKKLCKCHDQFVGQSATLFSIQPDAARVSGIAVWSRIGGMWRYSSFWPSVFFLIIGVICFRGRTRLRSVLQVLLFYFWDNLTSFCRLSQTIQGLLQLIWDTLFAHPFRSPCIWGVGKNPGEECSFFKNLASLVGGFQKEAPSTVITLYYQDLSNTFLMVQFQLLYKFMFIFSAY
jgi:hypothetical protein